MSEENDNVTSTNNESDKLVSEEQEVTQESAGNEMENQDNSRNEILENMLKEVLEKRKNLELSNTEIVDKLRSVESELQLIRDDMKPKTLTASVPVKSDNENKTDSNSKNKSVSMPTTGKYFVLKHVFKNVSNMKEDENQWSEAEEYYEERVYFYYSSRDPVGMYVCRTKKYLQFYLNCSKPTATGNWTIETPRKHVFISNRVDNIVAESIQIFDNKSSMWGWNKFIEWVKMETDFLVDDRLTAEIHVKIKKTTGIYKDNLRNFDETMEEFSDVVLVVNEQKFYVLKKLLAAHSSYFKALFLGHFQESDKSEIKLSGIDAADFQNYLEVLYGEYSINEFTVEGILLVADMYDTPLVIRKCEEFLLEKSKKTLKKKLQMSMKYHLEALNKQCRKEIKSVADIKSVLPGDIRDLDPAITTEFLEIALSIQ